MSLEVEVDGWRLVLMGGSWLYPDGEGFEPDEAGDVWVAAPDGRTATIAWSRGDESSFDRLLDSRAANDFGAFEVRTSMRGPVTRSDAEAFLHSLVPELIRVLA